MSSVVDRKTERIAKKKAGSRTTSRSRTGLCFSRDEKKGSTHRHGDYRAAALGYIRVFDCDIGPGHCPTQVFGRIVLRQH